MTTMLAVEALVVHYGPVVSLDRVSLDIRAGEVVAVVGANGAGKSTLIRAIAGQVRYAAGAVRLLDRPIDRLAAWQRARAGIGLCPEGRRIFSGLTVRENLDVASECDTEETERRIAEVFSLFPALRERDRAPGWQLSGGQQQMLAIGRALIRRPRLLVLDEPSLGLAPKAARELFAAIRATAGADRGVLLAEQNAAAAFDIADRVYVLERGRVVAHGHPAGIRGQPVLAAAFLG